MKEVAPVQQAAELGIGAGRLIFYEANTKE
jgi:hypothetical protein